MQHLKYEPLEKIKVSRAVNRIKYIEDAVTDKIVLDLGCFDETAYQLKSDTDFWLHKRVASKAKKVVGVDNSSLIPDEGLKPFENSTIIRQDVYELESIIKNIGKIDIILAGELIEHIPDVQLFLKKLKENDLLKGTELLITTPNGCATHNFIIGMFSMESNHQDHLGNFSFKTLNTQCIRAGFEKWDIIPYLSSFPEMKLKSKGIRKLPVILFEKAVNIFESIFPLLSFGWILRIRI